MATFTYNGRTFTDTDLPVATINALLSRGWSHVTGNEASAKVVSHVRRAIVNGSDRKAGDVETAEIKAWREAHPDEVSGFIALVADEITSAIVNGTLGERASHGEPQDPVAAEFDRLLVRDARIVLGAHKLKLPTKADAKIGGGLVDGNGVPFTRDSFLAGMADGVDRAGMFGKPGEAHRPRLQAEAEKNIAAAAKRAQNAAAKADGATGGLF